MAVAVDNAAHRVQAVVRVVRRAVAKLFAHELPVGDLVVLEVHADQVGEFAGKVNDLADLVEDWWDGLGVINSSSSFCVD